MKTYWSTLNRNSSGTSALQTGHCLVLVIVSIVHCRQQLCKHGSDTGSCKTCPQTAQSLLLKKNLNIIYWVNISSCT